MAGFEIQRRLAAEVMKCGLDKVKFDPESLAEIKESITKSDIRALISKGTISKRISNESSRSRSRLLLKQKKKGLRKGHGSRKGTANARSNKKEEWRNRIRKQRSFLKILKDKNSIKNETYWLLLNKAKGGFFRSERHLKIYLNEHNLFVKPGV